MKKALFCAALALALVIAAEPHLRSRIVHYAGALLGEAAQREAVQESSFSRQLGGYDRTDMLDVTLYYRFANTRTLGVQRAQLDIRREETVAKRIVQQLVKGPDASYERLSGVFPQGTQVISVTANGQTAFVTLSRDFLGRPDGAPADWEDLAVWQEEAALRRRLAVQSIVLALTEGARYQRVQLYVADTDDDIPQRIEMAWFDTSVTDPTLVLAPSPRDEQAMLTPQRTLNMVMEAWQSRDWAAMLPLLHARGAQLPTLSVFEAQMDELDITLLDYDASAGTVSFDGQRATVVLDAQIRSREGGDAQIVRESVLLTRVEDNWALSMDTLLQLMIRD
ncbi:MAG: GerMN domain-containing protein [Clostridia bacterium]|nr:GerMN domain-containing protein [Clostridia bacterium]